ncbi:hypothetical protein [Dysgonomonas sp. 25]|uniref:hypothetical protein n=1 Tax=Dysgonomonas sp. 25 TaxID=2302933 RepID=UPI0013D245EF|nr:hypothetical protein [Dysgonomonas sp. 25]NDV69950.1 hypothetical protein [Dysgonomonas sp. 25]
MKGLYIIFNLCIQALKYLLWPVIKLAESVIKFRDSSNRLRRKLHLLYGKKTGFKTNLKKSVSPANENIPMHLKITGDNAVVGSTKSVFITELPQLKTHPPVEPYKSEPLEPMPPPENEPPINPDDIIIETGAAIDPDDIDEIDIINPDDSFDDDFNYGDGVSIDDLEDAYSNMRKSKTLNEANEKTIEKLQGTDLEAFFALNDKMEGKSRDLLNNKLGSYANE